MKFFGLYTFLFMLALSAKATPYTLNDLEVLASERSYDEFFTHALDILPAERQERWKLLVETMGEGQLKQFLQKTHLERSNFQHMEKLFTWSHLRQNEFFRQRRQDVAAKWFQQCLASNSAPTSPCWEDLVLFWEKDRQEIDMAPRLLAIVAPYLAAPLTSSPSAARSQVSALFVLKPMLLDSVAQLQCKKDEIQQVVWQEAITRWQQSMTIESFLAALTELAHVGCWSTMASWSKSKLSMGASKNELDLAFALNKQFGKLTELEESLYYVSYLLGSPARGDTFNLAWNHVQELGQKPQSRDLLLTKLKKWRPLPGKIFADLDLAKRKTITRHLHQHFPEFIDFYAHTCIDFFGARKRFPEGNPAYSCREMFELATSEKDLLPESMIQSFQRGLSL